MLRVISRITASYVSHRVSSASLKRLVHNSIAKPVGPTSYGIQAQAGAQTKHSPPVQDLQLTDRDYDEAMNNLKTLGLDTILNSALDRWGKLDSHGKPYIRAEIKHQWRKNVILEFVNRLCDTAFVQQTSKSSECLSKEIDNILVTSALSLAETEDECVTILCPGAPHIGTEHIDKGVKFTLRNRVFFKNDQDKLCLALIWADENRNLYKSQAELSSTNTMWHGSLDEVLAMAEEVSNDPSNSGI